MARRKELTPHVPFEGVPNLADILTGISIGQAGQLPVPARTPTGTGFMQIGPALGPVLPTTQFTPGIPDPTGFELDPLGRGAAFATGKLGALPTEPVVETPVVAAPAVEPLSLPTIADPTLEAIPGVTEPATRSIEEIQSIASMLAPQVEAQPLTRQQLTGGDVFGLTPEQVHNVTATRVAQLQTKAATDKSALEFLRQSTGVKTAEKMVADKIQEEGAIGRAKFVAESTAAEAAKARNRSILLKTWEVKTTLANRLLADRAKASAEAASPTKAIDLWKARKSSIMLEFSKTNPLAAAGLTRIPDIDDALTKLEQDRTLPADSNLKMTTEERSFYKRIVSLGAVPAEEEI